MNYKILDTLHYFGAQAWTLFYFLLFSYFSDTSGGLEELFELS